MNYLKDVDVSDFEAIAYFEAVQALKRTFYRAPKEGLNATDTLLRFREEKTYNDGHAKKVMCRLVRNQARRILIDKFGKRTLTAMLDFMSKEQNDALRNEYKRIYHQMKRKPL